MSRRVASESDGEPNLWLAWGIKSSLRKYVNASGTVSYGQPAIWADDAFRFPVRNQRRRKDGRIERLECQGDVLFQAHGGLLRVGLAEPWVEFGGPDSFVSVISSGRREECSPRIQIARLSLVERPGEHLSEVSPVEFRANLTATGASLLGGFYFPGIELDRVRVLNVST